VTRDQAVGWSGEDGAALLGGAPVASGVAAIEGEDVNAGVAALEACGAAADATSCEAGALPAADEGEAVGLEAHAPAMTESATKSATMRRS
jgi:hypothetical protein